MVYTADVSKRLVEIDDDLLEQARRVTGAPTIRATVDTALRAVVDSETAIQHVARLRRRGALDLRLLAAARDPRLTRRD
jgi:Arc/MetJ family transcription regulator